MDIFKWLSGERTKRKFSKEIDYAIDVYNALPDDVKGRLAIKVFSVMDKKGWKNDFHVRNQFNPQASEQHKIVEDNIISTISVVLSTCSVPEKIKALKHFAVKDDLDIYKLIRQTDEQLNRPKNGSFYDAVRFYNRHKVEIALQRHQIKVAFLQREEQQRRASLKYEIDDYFYLSNRQIDNKDAERASIAQTIDSYGSMQKRGIIKKLRHMHYANMATHEILTTYRDEMSNFSERDIYKLANGVALDNFVRAENSIGAKENEIVAE